MEYNSRIANLNQAPAAGDHFGADPAAEYRARFCERTRLAREAAGFSRKQMAQILGLSLHVYTKNEERSPLSHMITGTFLSVTKTSYDWLSQGVGPGPADLQYIGERTHQMGIPQGMWHA